MPADASASPVVTVEGAHERVTAWIRGQVQGVGMRWWIRSRALERGLVGSARNLPDGRVEVIAEGRRIVLVDLLAVLRSGTAPGRVDVVIERWSDARGDLRGFRELS
jgi:acylphosphatase